jgi:Fe2+ or Zn2+ uptake regulation protein
MNCTFQTPEDKEKLQKELQKMTALRIAINHHLVHHHHGLSISAKHPQASPSPLPWLVS